ncbi:MAG: hypothetical protein NE328_18355 [Lentisphaeraceae bacterium]|nr:hypothetical protein [Lentisphaeraceae bacterium]
MNNCYGYCQKCEAIHSLGEGNSRQYALDLISKLEFKKRIDLDVSKENADPKYSTDCLFGEFRGQMFGVLECEDEAGEAVILKSYSCQHNGIWNCDGWVPPLVDTEVYQRVMEPSEKAIKDLGRKIDVMEKQDPARKELMKERKLISQELMKNLFELYFFSNFRGETVSIQEAFYREKGIPTGTGDCCAPKLLNYAALNNLKPLGISEFYFGLETRSGTRKHGEFYTSCDIKCEPILGFMLCGLDDL